MKDCAAALSSVTVSYPSAHGTVTALDNVSIGLERGSSTAIVGRSGSGKTTLISVLSLMRQPTSGQVFLNGSETSGLSNSQMADLRSARIGVVFQSYHLDPSLTATENVMLPGFSFPAPGPAAGPANGRGKSWTAWKWASWRNASPIKCRGDSNNGWPSGGPFSPNRPCS